MTADHADVSYDINMFIHLRMWKYTSSMNEKTINIIQEIS